MAQLPRDQNSCRASSGFSNPPTPAQSTSGLPWRRRTQSSTCTCHWAGPPIFPRRRQASLGDASTRGARKWHPRSLVPGPPGSARAGLRGEGQFAQSPGAYVSAVQAEHLAQDKPPAPLGVAAVSPGTPGATCHPETARHGPDSEGRSHPGRRRPAAGAPATYRRSPFRHITPYVSSLPLVFPDRQDLRNSATAAEDASPATRRRPDGGGDRGTGGACSRALHRRGVWHLALRGGHRTPWPSAFPHFPLVYWAAVPRALEKVVAA